MTTLHEKPIVFEDGTEIYLSHNDDAMIIQIDSNAHSRDATVDATITVSFNKEEAEALYNRLHKVIQRWTREDRNF